MALQATVPRLFLPYSDGLAHQLPAPQPRQTSILAAVSCGYSLNVAFADKQATQLAFAVLDVDLDIFVQLEVRCNVERNLCIIANRPRFEIRHTVGPIHSMPSRWRTSANLVQH